MLTGTVPELAIGGKKDLSIHDLRNSSSTVFGPWLLNSQQHGAAPDNFAPWLLNSQQHGAASDSFDPWLLNSQQQSEKGEDDDDDDEDLSDSSLSDYHPEEFTGSESEDEKSDSYPHKKPKIQEDTHSGYIDYEDEDVAKDRYCKAEKRSSSREKPDLRSEYVPWVSKSSDGERSIPDKEKWISSWSFENGGKERKGYHYLNIYGFYKRKTRMGGYGVIVRNPCGKPVFSSAYVQPKGESYFYHVLHGVKAGLALVFEHQIYDLKLMCNSFTLDLCLRQIFQRADAGLWETSRTPYACGACKTCLRFAIPATDEEFENLFPLLKDIIDLRDKMMCKSRFFRLVGASSSLNQAAYHLAKQLARKTPLLSTKPEAVITKPDAFGNELKTILYEDAYKDVQFYRQQLK